MRIFRKATKEDFIGCWKVLDAARWQMIRIGRQQWTPEYPNHQVLGDDLEAEAGYIIEQDGLIVAYGAVYQNGEPEYERLRGSWLSHEDYLVVHRLAVDPQFERRGLARDFLANVERLAIEQKIFSIKVDTNYDNVGMLHILQTSGYTYCGKVNYPVSGERLAYEKLLMKNNL